MAILSKRPVLGPSALVGLAALAMTVVGCSLAYRLGLTGDDRGLQFSHRLHYEDEGLDCVVCHAGYDTEETPSMPKMAQCALCHDEETEAEKPPELRIATLFDEGVYRAQRISALSDEVLFSHPAHAVDEEECGSCHRGIEASERIGELLPVTMDDCSSCHVELGIANECSTCHSRIGLDGAPDTHDGTWSALHGRVFRAGSTLTANRCDLCHQEQECNDCHFNEPPRSHDNFWRFRGHGLTARMDRSSCYVCHRTDSCEACHSEVRPQNHTGPWGSTQNRHCLSCHLSATDGCVVCHKATPSHSLGAPQPPDHVPGMNCLQCHGISAALPHVHKGEDCTLCHQ